MHTAAMPHQAQPTTVLLTSGLFAGVSGQHVSGHISHVDAGLSLPKKFNTISNRDRELFTYISANLQSGSSQITIMNRLIQTAAAILYITSSFKLTYAQDHDDSNSTWDDFMLIGVISFRQ